jgi:D-3-phosphoglycerate dehydrogenase / 2-oxoglutarate reductase
MCGYNNIRGTRPVTTADATTPTNRKHVLVPHAMGRAGLDILAAREDVRVTRYAPSIAPEAFHALLGDVAGVALSYTPFRRAELAAAPRLRVVARIGVGFDAVEVPALTARGIPLLVAGTANSTSVAEQALFFMLALAKRGAEMDRRTRQGIGHDRLGGLPMELAGKTVLIVGFGRIGSRTAPRCAAFGMTVLVYDPYKPAEAIRQAGCEPVADLDAALARADFVSIHCPRNAETLGMFGPARLARMRAGAFLINTARGGIVEEAALHAALLSGHLAGAGLDVFDREPPDAAHPLLQLESVIAAPHMAGVTAEAVAAMAAVTARNLLSVLDGNPARENVVNPEVLPPG